MQNPPPLSHEEPFWFFGQNSSQFSRVLGHFFLKKRRINGCTMIWSEFLYQEKKNLIFFFRFRTFLNCLGRKIKTALFEEGGRRVCISLTRKRPQNSYLPCTIYITKSYFMVKFWRLCQTYKHRNWQRRFADVCGSFRWLNAAWKETIFFCIFDVG